MKKILLPTDFSKLSGNALNYAVELAKNIQAEILLLHVYTIPLFAEDAVIIPTEQLLLEDALDNLEELKKVLIRSNPELEISCQALPGIPEDVIGNYAEQQHADLIVIGSQGGHYMQERILGNTASALIRKTNVPVLVINKETRFRVPKEMVLAVDFSETDNETVLKPLKQLARTFKAHVSVLNIFTEAETITTFGEIAESFRLEKALKQVRHTFFEIENPDVVRGINEFVKKHDIDMVAIISRKHSLIGRLFREPISKAMTFHSLVPLLTMHESINSESHEDNH